MEIASIFVVALPVLTALPVIDHLRRISQGNECAERTTHSLQVALASDIFAETALPKDASSR